MTDQDGAAVQRIFDLGGFELASGFVLPQATLGYRTVGTLNDAKDNAVLLPHITAVPRNS